MRFFLNEKLDPDIEGQQEDDVRTRTTDGYAELEYKIEDKYADTYVVGRDENTAFVVACLDHLLDPIKEQAESKNEAALTAEQKAWPTFATLLQNGINDRYSDGALIQLEDPDCGEAKWFIATVVGNIDFDKEQERAVKKIDAATTLVLEKSVQMLTEMNEHKPRYRWQAIKPFLEELGLVVLQNWAQSE